MGPWGILPRSPAKLGTVEPIQAEQPIELSTRFGSTAPNSSALFAEVAWPFRALSMHLARPYFLPPLTNLTYATTRTLPSVPSYLERSSLIPTNRNTCPPGA